MHIFVPLMPARRALARRTAASRVFGRQPSTEAESACGLVAVLAGTRSFVAIGDWVAHESPQALSRLGVDSAGSR